MMKYFKRSGLYKASNVSFNPTTKDAYSYAWWRFVAVVEGKLVFNNYRYSPSTGGHQRKVSQLMDTLGIKPDVVMPLPRGIRHDQTLAEMIIEAEETLCNEFLLEQIKQQERYQKQKTKRFTLKLEEYLDVVLAFRDYEIKPKSQFGTYNKIAVHQIVEDIEKDVQNAIHSFQRDAFGSVVFYV